MVLGLTRQRLYSTSSRTSAKSDYRALKTCPGGVLSCVIYGISRIAAKNKSGKWTCKCGKDLGSDPTRRAAAHVQPHHEG
ncbi:unnamed protein product [Ectocarpus sp. 12 AP-2014]